MMQQHLWDSTSSLGEAWAWAMWSACWQGGLAIALAWALCRACGERLPARLRPWPWRLAVLKMLLCLAAPAPLLLRLLPAPQHLPGHSTHGRSASSLGASGSSTGLPTASARGESGTNARAAIGGPGRAPSAQHLAAQAGAGSRAGAQGAANTSSATVDASAANGAAGDAAGDASAASTSGALGAGEATGAGPAREAGSPGARGSAEAPATGAAPNFAAQPAAPTASQAQAQALVDGRSREAQVLAARAGVGSEAGRGSWRPGVLLWPSALLLAWLGGVSWCLARLAREGARAQRLRRECSPLPADTLDADAQGVLSEMCRVLKVRRAPLLLCSPAGGPLLLGLLRPAIVLPAGMLAQGARGELKLALAHEAAHLKRRDLAWNLALTLAGVLFWFHPALWLARREWKLSVEQACDEIALEATQMPASSYGELLLRVASRGVAPLAASGAIGVAEDYALLRRRLSALAHAGQSSRRALRLGSALLLGAAAVGLVPWRVTAQEAAPEAVPEAPTSTSGSSTSDAAAPGAPMVLLGRFEQSSEARSLAFSPGGQRLASTSGASRIQLWQVEENGLKSEKALVATGPSHTGSQIAFDKSGQVLVEASDKARLWDVSQAKVLAALQVADPTPAQQRVYGPGFAVAAAVSPDGKMVASTGQFLIVHARQADGTWKKVLQEKFYYGLAVAFSPDGKTMIEAGHNGRLNIWDTSSLRNGSFIYSTSHSEPGVPAGTPKSMQERKRLVDQYARFLLALRKGVMVRSVGGMRSLAGQADEPNAFDNPMSGFALSPDGAWLGTSHIAFTRSIYEKMPPSAKTIEMRRGEMYLDGKLYKPKVTKKRIPSSIVLRDGRSGRFVRTIEAPGDINALAFSPNGRVVAGACDDGLRFWEVASGRLLFMLSEEKGVRALAFSPDGRLLATGSRDSILQPPPGGDLRVRVSGSDKSVRLWRFATASTSAAAGSASTSEVPGESATLAQVLAAPPEEMLTVTVASPAGAPVAGARVFWDHAEVSGARQRAVFIADANGRFEFPIERTRYKDGYYQTLLIADAPGFGPTRYDITPPRHNRREIIHLRTPSTLQLQLLDPARKPVPNATVRVARLGYGAGSMVQFPREILNRYQGRTDARGRLTMRGLPQGMLAELALGDEIRTSSGLGSGDRRGGKFAPLSTEDAVLLSSTLLSHTVQLQATATVRGRVAFGTGGKPVANSRVLARRINRAEAAGLNSGRDYSIASTQSDAAGRYTLSGLRPGNYVMWTWPGDKIRRDWTSVNPEVTLRAGGSNRVDFALIKGAIIEGRVVSEQTGQPVPRQTMGLFDAEENYQYVDSKGDGSFRFRAVGGKQHLWVHQNAASPPPGFRLPAKDKFDFSVANGQTYRITIRLPRAAIARAITGQVLAEDSSPVAGAQVSLEGLGGMNGYRHGRLLTADAQGRFTIEAKIAKNPARLWARAGDRLSARGVVAIGGDDVTLRVARDNGVTVLGRVVGKENGQPLANIEVELMSLAGGVASRSATAKTDAGGRVSFERQHAATGYWMRIEQAGYAMGSADIEPLRAGQSEEKTIQLERADSFVAGRVLHADGKPAAGLHVWASGALAIGRTDAQGRFRIGNVVRGPISINVSPVGGTGWNLTQTVSGRSDVRIVLSKAPRSTWMQDRERTKSKQDALIDQAAPEIQAQGWINSPALPMRELRGQIVLLHFWSSQFFPERALPPAIPEIAQDFAGRGVRVIGIHHAPMPMRRAGSTQLDPPFDLARLRQIAEGSGLSYPVALDAPDPSAPRSPRGAYSFSGATTTAYAGGPYAVIDRAGRIAYVGQSVGEAVSVIAGLLPGS